MPHPALQAIYNRFLVPFRLMPAEGLSAGKIAFSLSLGIIAGIFPVIGATTLLSLLFTFLFRLNILIVQSVQWTVALFQLLLIVPFMKSGAYLLTQKNIHINTSQLQQAFEHGTMAGVKSLWILHLYGIFSWILIAVPAGFILYFLFLHIFSKRKTGNNHTWFWINLYNYNLLFSHLQQHFIL